jgi:hypothetical protein
MQLNFLFILAMFIAQDNGVVINGWLWLIALVLTLLAQVTETFSKESR